MPIDTEHPAPAPDTVVSVDPRSGRATRTSLHTTTDDEVTAISRRAASAFPRFERAGRAGRARFLRAIAARLELHRDEIVSTAQRETGLPTARLTSEHARTCYQMRLFADVLDEGGYLEAAIDHAADTPMGPGPDLRRLLVPIGPVAVFGASNFPLAFSVPGGDTASALAAGCPVIVKAHGSHPLTSALCHQAMAEAAAETDIPADVVALVFGQDAGAALVADAHITAVGFTGSLSGAQALLRIIGDREQPIPFYGELSSINPLVVTPAAAAARGAEIARGFVTSITASGGQLCTKPGIVFVPDGPDGDVTVDSLRSALAASDHQVLLNERIHRSYLADSTALASLPAVDSVLTGTAAGPDGFSVTPMVLTLRAGDLSEASTTECFGPIAVVARYGDEAELRTGLERLPASLTGTVHAEAEESGLLAGLSELLRPKAGRLIFNGFPTGVRVSWAQTHGGPWPATNTVHTSVGTTSIRRFLRPVTWQDAPQPVLPEELRDGEHRIPLRLNGTLILP
ncbi:aldehyde dehydrogenase (NADP(+)) [Nocardia jiangxiensis]|uniref:Aldehyde dehydrogenase (NADP(+)) n=1 Tax=Nocardia jiangxiensis TaxID=282685 RepID=A0ABW6RZF8_9NOCA